MNDPLERSGRQKNFFRVVTVLGLVALVVLVWLVDLKALHDRAQELSGWMVFLLTVVLPLIGAPVSILYVLDGAKFGPWWGLVVALVAIALHLLASWWIAHSWLKRPVTSLLRRAEISIPQIPAGEAVPICLLVALVPGLSYTMKNYLLVLSGVSFRPFFWTCLPAHFFHASLAILFGDFTGGMTTARIVFLVIYGLVLTALSHYVVRRLKARRAASQAERQNFSPAG